MEAKKKLLTYAGLQALEDELEHLKVVKRKEVAGKIKEAREQGDLSENAEYDAAKEEQSKNAARVAEIRAILSSARISESSNAHIVVSIGSTVEVEDEKGKRQSYTIVGTTETNSLRHRISNESPLGAALIGSSKGDMVEYATPAGKKRSLKVIDITR